MKKVYLLIIFMLCLITLNVKADMEGPVILSHKVMVTNKDGAICYDDGKKTDKRIPYGTTLEVFHDIEGSYISVSNDQYNCSVKYSDVSAKDQKFNIQSVDVVKVDPTYAVVLTKSGINMRKGPSVTYSKIVTIPKGTILKLTHQAGTYWYYTEYNGKTGWVTSMDGYIGMDAREVLINYEPVNIYDSNNKTVLGKIPANTEITNYLSITAMSQSDLNYYVIYNGTKGYVRNMLYKVDKPGKIKLLKDYEITDEVTNKVIKRITANQELEYTMKAGENAFYFPEKGIIMYLNADDYQYITKSDISIKKTGYIGEGLYGEEKKEIEKEENKEEITDPAIEEETKSKMSTKDIIIICLLGGIFLALASLVVIKLINTKKNKPKKEEVVIVSSNNINENANNNESENKEI